MRYFKPILPFIIVSGIILVAGCEKDEPEAIPELPQIAFKDLAFIEGSSASHSDSIRVTITFSDGDFDLGLGLTEEHFQPPYHLANYFYVQNGTLHELHSGLRLIDSGYQPFIEPASGQFGKLATYRKIVNEVNAAESYSCSRYEWNTLYVNEADFAFIDNSHGITDTVFYNGTKAAIVSDTFLVEVNPNGFNIEVDFLVEQNDGTFREFDWREEYCIGSFDGRFPFLEDLFDGGIIRSGPFTIIGSSDRSGELIYTMASAGFTPVFSGKNIRLRITIKDRSLNESNVIETPSLLIP